eukprot:m.138390 g.138390  ORF g.138390 m.138390 type:complete len:340 (-) comp14777_c0_seq2:191-1210(-)
MAVVTMAVSWTVVLCLCLLKITLIESVEQHLGTSADRPVLVFVSALLGHQEEDIATETKIALYTAIHAREGKGMDIVIVTEEINVKLFESWTTNCAAQDVNFLFIPTNFSTVIGKIHSLQLASESKCSPLRHHSGEGGALKVFLPEYLYKRGVHRAIYLDTDIIVNVDPGKLWKNFTTSFTPGETMFAASKISNREICSCFMYLDVETMFKQGWDSENDWFLNNLHGKYLASQASGCSDQSVYTVMFNKFPKQVIELRDIMLNQCQHFNNRAWAKGPKIPKFLEKFVSDYKGGDQEWEIFHYNCDTKNFQRHINYVKGTGAWKMYHEIMPKFKKVEGVC